MQSKAGNNRIGLVDLCKGICILFVIITHFSWTQAERLQLLFPFWIDMAIPIFLVLSGYVLSLSYQKKGIDSVEVAYQPKNWLKSFLRYTIPYCIVILIELTIKITQDIVRGGGADLKSYLSAVLSGGYGPGSYYYPILIQLLLIYPLLYSILFHLKERGLLLLFIANLIFELLKEPFAISAELYRLCIFRYIYLLGFGCYIGLYGFNANIVKWSSSIFAAISIVFLIVTQYTAYTAKVFTNWTTTSLAAIGFILPLVATLLLKVKKILSVFKPLVLLGRASYHIYFMQMVYYAFFNNMLAQVLHNRWLLLLCNLIICLSIGLLFYFLEGLLQKVCNDKFFKKIE